MFLHPNRVVIIVIVIIVVAVVRAVAAPRRRPFDLMVCQGIARESSIESGPMRVGYLNRIYCMLDFSQACLSLFL